MTDKEITKQQFEDRLYTEERYLERQVIIINSILDLSSTVKGIRKMIELIFITIFVCFGVLIFGG